MDGAKPGLAALLLEFAVLAGALIAVPFIVALDTELFNSGSAEHSATEISQEILLLSSAVLFGAAALKHAESRRFLVLITGFLACMFIRELDWWFDAITHGFWVYPALLTAISAIAYASRDMSQLFRAMADYMATRAHAYIAAGLVIVLFFSRLFGTTSLLQEVMGGNYHPASKTFVQEGIELLGYTLLAFGSACHYLGLRNRSPSN